MWLLGARGSGEWELLFDGHRVSVMQNEKVPGIHCTTTHIQSTGLKNCSESKFMLFLSHTHTTGPNVGNLGSRWLGGREGVSFDHYHIFYPSSRALYPLQPHDGDAVLSQMKQWDSESLDNFPKSS